MLENIFRHVEEENRTPYEAAIHGTREVALPVMATTLSLVVIFLPVAFMTGYARRFIHPFGWTMAFSIMISMIVSFTLTPMLSSRFLKVSDAARDVRTKESRLFRAIDNVYAASLKWTLAHPMTIIAVSAIAFVLTFPLNQMVGRTFIPDEDTGEFTVHMDTPQGTSHEGTVELANSVAAEARGVDGVEHLEVIAGADRYNHFHLIYYLRPIAERKATQDEIMSRVRRIVARHPGMTPIVTLVTP